MRGIGAVRTGLQSHWPGLFGRLLRLSALLLFRDPQQGAQTVVYCAVLPDQAVIDARLCGKLVVDCRPVDVRPPAATNYRDADRLWELATRICAGLGGDARSMATEPAAAATAD